MAASPAWQALCLKNTLSDNGGVTRGICKMDEQNNLTEVVETKNIVKTATGAEADGRGRGCKFSGFHEHVGIDSGVPGCAGRRLQRVL